MFSIRDFLSSKLLIKCLLLWTDFMHVATLFIVKFPQRWVTSRQCYSSFDPLVCSECIFVMISRECLRCWNHFHRYDAVTDNAVYRNWAWVGGREQRWGQLIWQRKSTICLTGKSSVMQLSSVAFIEQRVLNILLYISKVEYNGQYRFYLYTKQFFLSLAQTEV